MFKNRLKEIEIQTGKTKDRREAERKHTVRQRQEKHPLGTYDFLQGTPSTFHASNM